VKYNKGKAPYAEERYLKEAHRLYSVLDRRLAQHESYAVTCTGHFFAISCRSEGQRSVADQKASNVGESGTAQGGQKAA
jgi:hypothetical protein